MSTLKSLSRSFRLSAGSCLLLLLLVFGFSVPQAFADKVCLKASLTKQNKIKFKRTATTGTCPRGTTELVDTSVLTGPAGAAGATGITGVNGLSGDTGSSGATGTTGPIGSTGAAGADGALGIFGDGSSGALVASASTTLSSLGKYTDITINPGVVLALPYNTTLRCTGTLTNNGTIVSLAPSNGGEYRVLSGAAVTYYPSILQAGAGYGVSLASSGEYGTNSGNLAGGLSGFSMLVDEARQVLSVAKPGGGGGPGLDLGRGGSGGGSMAILCKTAIINNGAITATGTPGSDGGGGGAGGLLILGSNGTVTNTASSNINSRGGNGGAFTTSIGAGGGGGGGVVHVIAPAFANSGTITVTGGSGGTAGNVTISPRLGGSGGGSGGGRGGSGSSIAAGGAASGQSLGSDGHLIHSAISPVGLVW